MYTRHVSNQIVLRQNWRRQFWTLFLSAKFQFSFWANFMKEFPPQQKFHCKVLNSMRFRAGHCMFGYTPGIYTATPFVILAIKKMYVDQYLHQRPGRVGLNFTLQSPVSILKNQIKWRAHWRGSYHKYGKYNDRSPTHHLFVWQQQCSAITLY